MKFAIACLLGLARAGDWPTNDEEMCQILGGEDHYDECMDHMANDCVSEIVWGCANTHEGDADAAFACLEAHEAEGKACMEGGFFGKAKKIANKKKAKKIANKKKAKKIARKIHALQNMEAWDPNHEEFCAVMDHIDDTYGENEFTHDQCMTAVACGNNWSLAQGCIAEGNRVGSTDGEEAGWTAGLTCLGEQQWDESCNLFGKKGKGKKAMKAGRKGKKYLQNMEAWNPNHEEFCAVMDHIDDTYGENEFTYDQCMAHVGCGSNWGLAQACIAEGNAAGATGGEEAGWTAGLTCLDNTQWDESCNLFGKKGKGKKAAAKKGKKGRKVLQFLGHPSREEFCGGIAKYTEMDYDTCYNGSYCGDNWAKAMKCYDYADGLDAPEEARLEAGLGCLGETQWDECSMFGKKKRGGRFFF